MSQLIRKDVTQEEYDNLGKYDDTIMYYTTDTKNVYVGSRPLNDVTVMTSLKWEEYEGEEVEH